MKKNDLILFQNILTGNLKPWKKNDYSTDKYKDLLSEIKSEELQFQPINEIDFFPPHSPKCKCYKALIQNESYRYFNLLHELINNADDDTEKAYWVKLTLSIKIPMLLNQIRSIVEERNYSLSDLDPEADNKLKEPGLSEPYFIVLLLKTSLVWLFLEIQEIYKNHSFSKTEAEIYLEYFAESVPKYGFVKDAPEITLPVTIKRTIQPEESAFKPIKGDIQNIKLGVLDYSSINNVEMFAKVEIELHAYEIIDKDYYFIKNKKESNSRNLAAIVQILIDCNYFRRNILNSTKKATNNNIRKYIEKRYSTDISQQFRRLTDKHIEAVKAKYSWVDKLTPLR